MLVNERKENRISSYFIRSVSVLLVLIMLFSCLPMKAAAITETMSEPGEPIAAIDESDESELGKPSVPTEMPTEDTYILMVNTGKAGGSSVLYFNIRYKDRDGIARSEFIFPHLDSLETGYKIASAASDPGARAKHVKDISGYTSIWNYKTEGKTTVRDGLTSDTEDMYVFTLPFGMSSLVDISFFMVYNTKAAAGSKNEWTCNDIRLYRADALYGLDMMGYYSNEYYVSFRGEMLAAFDKKQENSGDFSLTASDKLFKLTQNENLSYGLKTDLKPEEKTYDSAAIDKELLFRMDIADMYGAGIEALANEIKDKKAYISGMNICEALTVEFSYEDIYGNRRKVHLPFITSFAAWVTDINENLSKKAFVGLAQQGDTIMFTGKFPKYKKMAGYKLLYGQKAASTAGITESGGSQRRQERYNALSSDVLNYMGLSIFDAVNVSVDVFADDAMLRCTTTGTPIYYYKSKTPEGINISNNVERNLYYDFKTMPAGSENSITLLPQTSQESYIFEIATDDMAAAATKADLSFTLTYVNTIGEEKECAPIKARNAVRDFYGYWPGDGEDVAYYAATNAGGVIVFSVNYSDVSYFKSMEINLDRASRDEWQFKSIYIYRVAAVSQRRGKWLSASRSIQGISTDREFSRDYNKDDLMGRYEKRHLLGENKRNLIINFNEGGNGGNVSEKEINWEDISKSMTYNETHQDLGFTKARYKYSVHVNVCSNSSAEDEDNDCGSNNKFYFQLIFQNGSTAYVQANQQIMGDGFRAGHTETFSIASNRNYGDLKALRIIPDDTQEDCDINDKLKIQRIEVAQTGTGGVCSTWIIDNVGWISIDYKDSGAKTTVRGEKLRSETEMAVNQRVNSRGYSVSFVVALTTGLAAEKLPQYQGMLVATVSYKNTNEEYCTTDIDVIEAIGDYAQKQTAIGELAVSNHKMYSGKSFRQTDPSYMLRPNHTDRFMITLLDVKNILSITFYCAASVNTTWRVNSVDIYNIVEDGDLLLNSKGEFQHDGEIKLLTTSTSVGGYEQMVSYDSLKKTSTVEEFTIEFEKNTISIDQETWISEIEREPTSNDDSLNIYIFFDSSVNPAGLHTINSVVQYQERDSDRTQQITSKAMDISVKNNMAYAIGVSAKGMMNLFDMTIQSDRSAKVDHAVITHMRSGVVVNSYFLDYSSLDAYYKIISAPSDRDDIAAENQVVTVQFAQDTTPAVLNSDTNVAVSFTYTSLNDDPGTSNLEYDSPYVFLTDQDISQIRNGSVVDINFSQQYVREIKKVTFAAIGTVNATVKSALVMTYMTDVDGVTKRTGYYSFDHITPITRTRYSISRTEKEVTPLTLSFRTMEKMDIDGLGDTKVLLRVGVKDSFGDNTELEFSNMLDLGVSGKIASEEKLTVRMLLSDVSAIRYIHIEPYTTGTTPASSWPVESMNAKWILNGSETTVAREVKQFVEEGRGYTLNCANVYVQATTRVVDENGEIINNQTTRKSSISLTLDKGCYLRFTADAVNSVDGNGCLVVAKRVSGGNDNFTMSSEGSNYTFKPKPHLSGDALYEITITSEEEPEKTLTINLTVKPDPDYKEPETTTVPAETTTAETTTAETTTAETTTVETTTVETTTAEMTTAETTTVETTTAETTTSEPTTAESTTAESTTAEMTTENVSTENNNTDPTVGT